jgi:UDP-N-acetylglucosamine 1-carboxyvinyltransferase
MEKLVILGGNKLNGDVEISGAKNAAVAVIPAALLVEGVCTIENVPDIQDVIVIVDILSFFGAKIKFLDRHTLEINCKNLTYRLAPYELVKKLRASYYLLGSLLGRFSKADVFLPGGCHFGVRPVDQHIKGFHALGANVDLKHGIIKAEAKKLVGSSIYLDIVSVGATINIMLAACKAEGLTIIENAAKEPHVVDVANFLNSMGANIKGAGTDVIKIMGVKNMVGGSYSLIPDQIEAGTFMIATAATGGDVTIRNVIPKHLESVTSKLQEMNVIVEEFDDSIRVCRTGKLLNANVKTLPYPGFPTDLQPLITTLLSIASGTSVVTESVWDNRFQYVNELRRMGAQIKVDGQSAYVEGIDHLMGAPVQATDLRAGAALIVAGLAAHGVTEVHNAIYIDRGYENIEQKLSKLNAQIVRKKDDLTLLEEVL